MSFPQRLSHSNHRTERGRQPNKYFLVAG